jgi:hypothetical protein
MVHPHKQYGEEGATGNLVPKPLTYFYRCTIESILSGCITAWYGNSTARNRKAFQRMVRSPNTSPRANYLLSRTPTAPDVAGRTKRSSWTTTI